VIEAAFLEANPDLSADMVLTTCRGQAIYEVRICLNRDLSPRDCARQTLTRECSLDRALLHPLR
jgi:ribonuclease T2